MSIQSKIDQNRTDIERLKEEGKRLQRELEASRVTYCIGDRFRGMCDTNKYMLIKNWTGKVGVINLADGLLYGIDAIKVMDTFRITEQEFARIVSCPHASLIRYWDNRKRKRL